MSDPIYPGAVWRPGVAAGYAFGRNRMHVAVAHFTVGVNSAPIGDRGYFQFLVSRDGTVIQFAEVDAMCWHAGEWNVYGPGIEVEYWSAVDGDQVFTDAARDATAALIGWLNVEWGIPLDYYDGPRQSPSDQRGFMSHRSLMQTDPHHDFWPQEDWDRMTGDDMPLTQADAELVAGEVARWFTGQRLDLNDAGLNNGGGLYNALTAIMAALDADNATKADVGAGGGGAGGLSDAQVRAIVREELDKTKLSH